jgi:geranyl-CoA carboxylase alpha subunit
MKKILIANRGEIACRVIRTAQSLGIATVAVHSDADTDARHVRLADEAVRLGPAPVGESYLNIDAILEAARRSGADAIHPGYGFLSENASFAERCAEAGLTFIGPPEDAIRLMGSKREAKIAMIEAGVPCVPGYEGPNQDEDFLLDEAARIGYPLMIKASAGGGGRGMRRVDDPAATREALQRARSEAQNAFGSGELILEKCVDHARHVEIQVFGDTHGNVVYLGERDCSMQRRHQKVVEEAPSPAVTPELRRAMGEAAVLAAQSCRYVGAGTVEFLLGQDNAFYFLEMNTRLQVEHPVTEMVTGEDLVDWQIRVARGEALPRRQDEIQLSGHAIEVRLYAEDPANSFLPQTGPLHVWRTADPQLARTDHGIVEGGAVSRFYDPMIAKIICHGRDRAEALSRLQRALRETVLLGVTHNKGFLLDLIDTPVFREGAATTHFIDDHWRTSPWTPAVDVAEVLALAGLALALQPLETAGSTGGLPAIARRPFVLGLGNASHQIVLDRTGPQDYRMVCDSDAGAGSISLVSREGPRIRYRWKGVRKTAHASLDGGRVYLDTGHHSLVLDDQTHRPPQAADGAGSGILKAPMDGAVTAVLAGMGDSVRKGDTVLVIEAMKMEHLVRADRDGVLKELTAVKGQQVKGRQRLAVIADL